MFQWWQAVGNTDSNLTNPRFELQTSRPRDERITVQPTGQKTKIYRKQKCNAIMYAALKILKSQKKKTQLMVKAAKY